MHIISGNYEEAIRSVNIALNNEPDMAPALLHRASILACDKRTAMQAINDLSKYLEIYPNSIKAYRERARLYNLLGQAAEAEKDEKTLLGYNSGFWYDIGPLQLLYYGE